MHRPGRLMSWSRSEKEEDEHLAYAARYALYLEERLAVAERRSHVCRGCGARIEIRKTSATCSDGCRVRVAMGARQGDETEAR